MAAGVLGSGVAVGFVAFAGYTVSVGRRVPRPGSEVVVVLGCRLRHNRVGPMLKRRLDRGVEVFGVERGLGGAPLMVVSGGQGGGETVPEAAAMVDYLEAQGISGEVMVREDRSRNTEENLRFTARELRCRGFDPTAVRMTVLTSDFHVLRTARLARRLGLNVQVTGARTARLLLRKSFLREFVAILASPVTGPVSGRLRAAG
ncbi:hypothetical protein NSK11_contig00049-0017 [Nocardia seriolae]|uniref:DUF218 domain-containing protein n=1 Tax=Nocardia seriolae TaxID=37332 RepID=A0ABC9YUP2_9NOCA|nr:hypothetical protein NS07_v2contig00045-0017 [Nocardia seriolae]GAP29099.1 hypothetical protein NSK11_contig00049-0017 [Nocardia seriolae]